MSSCFIEVDPNVDDPEYMGEYDTDTTSLASAVKSHVFENGRRYHGWHEVGSVHPLPNDEQEQERMNLQHHICLLLRNGRLYESPSIENPEAILDVGTGNGIWAIDCGDVYPNAKVIGVDLSPIQPRWVPPNVLFEVDDVEDTWSYPDNTFDLIHIRQLAGFIDNWPKMYAQAMRVLKPGGTIEINDFVGIACDDGSVPEHALGLKWSKMCIDSIKKTGRKLPTKEHVEELTSMGFEQVKYNHTKLAIGTWPKSKTDKILGYYMLQHLNDGCEGISLGMFTRFLGLNRSEVDLVNDGFRRDMKNRDYHMYVHYYVTYGKKPMECNGDSAAMRREW